MSNTPQLLSYKKPNIRNLSHNSSSPPSPSSPSITSSPQLGSVEPGTRKVSSRRKALQDFYKIQQSESSPVNQKSNKENIDIEHEVDITNAKELDEWIKTKPIIEILKLRNSINSDLNSQDSENKSIIYNNYYELIKLNKILDDLLRPKVMEKKIDAGGLGIFVDNSIVTNSTADEDIVESNLRELSDFINGKAKKFNNDFESVVKALQEEKLENTSMSSTTGVFEKNISVLSEKIDKEMLLEEIDFILQRKIDMEDKFNSELSDEVKKIIHNLDSAKNELLIEQLNTLIIKSN